MNTPLSIGLRSAALLLGLALAACRQESTETPPAQVSTGPAAPREAAPTPAEEPTRPKAPERVFNDRNLRLGDWYPRLKERTSPAADRWFTEIIGPVARRDLEQLLQASLGGSGSSVAEQLGPKCQALRLRPRKLELEPVSPGVRLGRAASWETEELSLAAALADFTEPLRGTGEKRLRVDVTSVDQLDERTFRARAQVRVANLAGDRPLQVEGAWTSLWRVVAKGKRVVLDELRAESYSLLELSGIAFEEWTDPVLADQRLSRGIRRGALEEARRFDRLVGFPNAFLGMHGVALGDVDGDGLEDVYVAQRAGRPNLLLMHQPDGTVREEARQRGVDFLDNTSAVLIFDLNGDAARDLILGRGPDIVLCFNDGAGRFDQRRVLSGVGSEDVYTVSAADYDRDGDLDLYATRYVKGGIAGGVPTPYFDATNGATNMLWRNEGEERFVLATQEAGLDVENNRFSLSSIWEDLDADGDLDLYVTNDFGRNNLYRNDGDRFVDIADIVGAYDMAAGMGVTCSDVDRDGDIDMYVSNMFTAAGSRVTTHPRFMRTQGLDARAGYAKHTRGNTLLLNRGDGKFEDATERSAAGPGGWAWGALLLDFENDGHSDIFVPNGFLTGRKPNDLESFFWRVVVNASPAQPPATPEYANAWVAISQLSQVEGFSWNGYERNYAYWNTGAGRFVDASFVSGLDYLDDARSVGVVDWDGDGQLDLWVRNRTAPILRFLRNAWSDPGQWISVELRASGRNTDGIGARVRVVSASGAQQARRVYSGEGYLGGSSRRLHFGLGAEAGAVRIAVEWPDGTTQEHADVAAGQLVRITQGRAEVQVVAQPRADLFQNQAPAPIEREFGPLGARVTLLDKLPLAVLDLPAFDGARRKVRDFAGQTLLLVLWASWDDESVATLERLAHAQAALTEARVAVYPLNLDNVRDEAYARGALAQTGLSEAGGRIDRSAFTLFELIMFESLGAYSDQPLPVTFLLDEQGRLSLFYLGELDPAQAIDDAVRANLSGPEGGRWPTGLTGGSWIRRGPARDIEQLMGFFKHSGRRELEAAMRSELAERRKFGD